MDIRATILDAIERRGLSERKVSNDVFGHDTAIRDLKRSGSLSTARLLPLCEYLGLEITIGDYNSNDRRCSQLEAFTDGLKEDLGLLPTSNLDELVVAVRELQRPATEAVRAAYANMEHLSDLITGKVAADLATTLVSLAGRSGPPGAPPPGPLSDDDSEPDFEDDNQEWTLPRINALTKKIQQDAARQGEPLSVSELLKIVQLHIKEG